MERKINREQFDAFTSMNSQSFGLILNHLILLIKNPMD